MGPSSRMLTVEQAAQILGLTKHAVVELIGSGTLAWTMAADRTTVIVEVPDDADRFLREIGTAARSGDVARQVSPAASPRSTMTTPRRRRETPALTDLDAWSQPK